MTKRLLLLTLRNLAAVSTVPLGFYLIGPERAVVGILILVGALLAVYLCYSFAEYEIERGRQ